MCLYTIIVALSKQTISQGDKLFAKQTVSRSVVEPEKHTNMSRSFYIQSVTIMQVVS